MEEHKGKVTFQGNPLTLVGKQLTIGIGAPEFEVLGKDLNPVTLSSFQGKVVIIASVPSLDTPVCDLETKRFNSEAANIGNDIQIVAISMDLPFAQKRWCGTAGVEKVVTLSDHKNASFGTAYGVLIKELRLLARAIFIIDRQGMIRYIQIVPEVTKEPDYEAVLAAAKKLI